MRRSRLGRILAAGWMAGVMGWTFPAAAGEIDDLKAQVKMLMERVESLERKQAEAREAKETMSEAETAKAAAVPEKVVRPGEEKVKLTLSGWVNRGVLLADDGLQSDAYHVDGTFPTRFRLIGEAKANENLTIGSAIEVQFSSNSGYTANQFSQDNGAGTNSFTERRLEVYFQGDAWGKVWFGQGWTASEGSSEVDLSGSSLAGYSFTTLTAGGTRFRREDGSLQDDDATNPNVNDVFTNLDGLGRNDRIRYDTPSLSGVTFSVGSTQGDAYDAAVRYAVKLSGVKLAAAVGGATLNPATRDDFRDQYSGSASLLWENGFNVTAAGGTQEALATDRDDPHFKYLKLGLQRAWFDAGATHFSIDRHETDDLAANGDEAVNHGFQVVQNLPEWGTDLYLSLRRFELDRTGVQYQNVTAGMIGAQVRF